MVNVSFGGQEPGPSDPCPAYAKLDPASIQTIDGVPPSVVASLSGKGEAISRPAAPQQPVMAASFQTAPSTRTAAAPQADMSASPVISRPAPKPAAIATAQTPKAPAAPAYTAAEPEPAYAPAPQMARAAASTAQPVNYQALPPASCGPCAYIHSIGRSRGSAGPEFASKAEPLRQGRQASGRRCRRAVHGRPAVAARIALRPSSRKCRRHYPGSLRTPALVAILDGRKAAYGMTGVVASAGSGVFSGCPASAGRGGRTTVTVQHASPATFADTPPSSERLSEFCRAPTRI